MSQKAIFCILMNWGMLAPIPKGSIWLLFVKEFFVRFIEFNEDNLYDKICR